MADQLPKFTVADLVKGGAPEGLVPFLSTWAGTFRVSHIRWPETNPWAVCPDENAGFGLSFMVSLNTPLILKKRD